MSELMLCKMCNGLFENVRPDLTEDQAFLLDLHRGLGGAAKCHCGYIGKADMISESQVKGLLVLVPSTPENIADAEQKVIEIFKKGEGLIATLRMLSELGINCDIFNFENLDHHCGKFKFNIAYN